jgi:hypothetical protein
VKCLTAFSFLNPVESAKTFACCRVREQMGEIIIPCGSKIPRQKLIAIDKFITSFIMLYSKYMNLGGAPMVTNRAIRIISVIIALAFVLGCASYESKVVPFKMPTAYPNAQEVAGATIAAQAYSDKKEAEDAFGFDIIGAGLMPVRVVFDNKGKHLIDIVANQTFLVDVDNNLWPVLEERMAYDRIQKKTEFGKVAPEGAKYGMLGGIAGGVIGAAIGIVSGHNVADAAMKGAAVGAAGGIIGGGSKGMSDMDVQAQIRSDLEKRSLERRSVMPGEIAQGFIFFPGESKKANELRLQIREADTGKSYPLVMKF